MCVGKLLPFLRDKNPQVRGLALSNLLPHTSKESPQRKIFFNSSQSGLTKDNNDGVIRDLKLLCRDQLSVAHDAFRALVNLSESSLLVEPLSEPAFLEFIVSYLITPQSVLADLASMLLSNLTAFPAACSAVLSLTIPVIFEPGLSNRYYATQSRCATSTPPFPYPPGGVEIALALPLMIDAFAQGVHIEEDASKRIRKGSLHFLASVFANLTSLPAGRDFFLNPRPTDVSKPNSNLDYPLSKLVVFTEHNDVIRRGGVAAVIKNCAFKAQAHRALLTAEGIKVSPSDAEAPGVDLLPHLLLPLAGPEEYDLEDQEKFPSALQFLPPSKSREPDPTLRLTHVETLLLLCTTRWGRDVLRKNGTYEIVRVMHEHEAEDKVSEHIERLVNLLKSDEDPNLIEEEFNTPLNVDGRGDEDDEDDEEIIEV